MRRRSRFRVHVLGVALGLLVAAPPGPVRAQGPPGPVGLGEAVPVGPELPYEDVRAAVSPHGRWLDLPRYGEVWQPWTEEVGPGFRPYLTGGRWVLTPAGWSFESRWSWGAITFHYGRWAYAPTYGWVWVPGTRWAASWCRWRVGDGFIGWSPLPPAAGHYAGFDPYFLWVFVPARHFVHPRVHAYAVGRDRFVRFYRSSRRYHRRRVIRGGYYYPGPRHRWVARYTERIPRRAVRRPGRYHGRRDYAPRRHRAAPRYRGGRVDRSPPRHRGGRVDRSPPRQRRGRVDRAPPARRGRVDRAPPARRGRGVRRGRAQPRRGRGVRRGSGSRRRGR